MADELNVQFSRFSAFYTPLIATLAGSFLKDEGFAPKHSVSPAGRSAIEGLVNGSVHVCQRRRRKASARSRRATGHRPSISRRSTRWTDSS